MSRPHEHCRRLSVQTGPQSQREGPTPHEVCHSNFAYRGNIKPSNVPEDEEFYFLLDDEKETEEQV